EKARDSQGEVVALFSGQGSQYVNMGRELVCHFPTMMASQIAMDKQFSLASSGNVSEVLYPIPVFDTAKKAQQEQLLRLTEYAQPALGSMSVGLFNTFKQAGFKPDFTAGHSFGELTALWAAGVYSEHDYMQLAIARGQAMSAPEDADFDAGSMAAVIGEVSLIEAKIAEIEGVSIANYNAHNQAVIAGSKSAITEATLTLTDLGLKVIELPVSAAFHTPLVKHAQQPFATAIDNVKFMKPAVRVFANGTGEAHSTEPNKIKAALKDHILESVQFSKEIENLYKAGGRIFVEFGPKNVLTGLVNNILQDKTDVVSIATNANAKQSADLQLRLAAVQLAVLGLDLDNIDPYSAINRPTIPPKKSPLAMKLSGAAYVSPKTQQAFQDGLNDNWKISNHQPPITEVKEVIKEVIVEKVVEKIVYVDSKGVPFVNQSAVKEPSTIALNNKIDPTNIQDSVAQLIEHQSQLLSVHQAYLEGPNQYADTFKTVLTAQAGQQKLPEGLDKTLSMYHDFQTETLRVHETYLNNQTESMQQMLSSVSDSNSPQTETMRQRQTVTAAEKNNATIDSLHLQEQLQATHNTIQAVKSNPGTMQYNHIENKSDVVLSHSGSTSGLAIADTMLAVVADKTGYPTEMLELSMDMEADLGIDSIKRVEILGAVQDQVTDLPELDAEQLAQMRTLQEIVTYMNSVVGNTQPTLTDNVDTKLVSPARLDSQLIEQIMLSVVADKTGYPTEMLELSMDMEADLGIDSIKRVEILGAVQDQVTDLPELDAEQLAQMRTLEEIVTYMNSVMGQTQSTLPANTNPTPVTSSRMDPQLIEQIMLSVVADKTGYPTEMLELSMDMEADLGIDSIKRVEILGAVQDQVTDLPELDAEQLAQMRTLQEIVAYMNSVMGQTQPTLPANTNPTPESPSCLDPKLIEQIMLSVVADKTGYPTEMLELSMDMEADLGIDSIKRVEILGAVQDQVSDLPELDAEQLAQMRTLQEIVAYMNSVMGQTQSILPAKTNPTPVTSSCMDPQLIEQIMLSVVADKTGYPTEMLELSMDMEADLGIDSIKRVEILGAVQDQVVDLPELDAEQLAQMRTLEEIVTYMNAVMGQTQPTLTANVKTNTMPVTSIDPQLIEQIMLSVVADKTGYPTEMLELSMDMEAD
ncbi:MAG: phosphopantetheine-binding protein, partial [Psychromonas sp.]